jgi:hypothetical protein
LSFEFKCPQLITGNSTESAVVQKKLQLSIAKTKYITGTQREGDRLKLSLSATCTDTPAQGFIADLSVIQ